MTAIPTMLSCQRLKSSPNGHRGIETISHGRIVSAGVTHHFLVLYLRVWYGWLGDALTREIKIISDEETSRKNPLLFRWGFTHAAPRVETISANFPKQLSLPGPAALPDSSHRYVCFLLQFIHSTVSVITNTPESRCRCLRLHFPGSALFIPVKVEVLPWQRLNPSFGPQHLSTHVGTGRVSDVPQHLSSHTRSRETWPGGRGDSLSTDTESYLANPVFVRNLEPKLLKALYRFSNDIPVHSISTGCPTLTQSRWTPSCHTWRGTNLTWQKWVGTSLLLIKLGKVGEKNLSKGTLY